MACNLLEVLVFSLKKANLCVNNALLQENELLRDIFQLGPPVLKQLVLNSRSVKQERVSCYTIEFCLGH